MTGHPYTVARMPMARAAGAPSVMAGVYTGAELQPYTGRPGALAAFALPSRVGRRRFYRDGAVELIADGARRKGGAA